MATAVIVVSVTCRIKCDPKDVRDYNEGRRMAQDLKSKIGQLESHAQDALENHDDVIETTDTDYEVDEMEFDDDEESSEEED